LTKPLIFHLLRCNINSYILFMLRFFYFSW